MAEYYLSQHTERPILILLSPSFRAKINIKLKKPSLYYFMFQNDPPLSNQSPGRALLNSWQKETTLHSEYSSAHLMRYSLRNSTGLGNSITCGQMKRFLTKHSWYITPTNPYLHLHTPLPTGWPKLFWKNPFIYRKKSVQFSKKNPYNFRKKPYNPYIFLKNPYNQ